MLSEFIDTHRDEIVERARARVAIRRGVSASERDAGDGVPLFLAQLTALLREAQDAGEPSLSEEHAREILGATAEAHGDTMLRAGLTVAQLVERYGDVCQAVTDHAVALGFAITTEEYRSLNLCLDVATSRAVTSFSASRDVLMARAGTERLGALAHELRNLLSTAVLSYEALRRGGVGLDGKTGAVLGRSLQGLRETIDRSLAEVRLSAGLHHLERVRVLDFIEEIEAGALLDARARGLALHVSTIDPALAMQVDRQLLTSAVANLVQNALKFTRPAGRVRVTAREDGARVWIDVEDQCGGLPPGKAEELFRPFHRESTDRSGLGLGLTISRDAVRANGGELRVRNFPGTGCVFTVDVPRAP